MGVFLCSSTKKEQSHPAELLLKCMIQFLQVHQGAGLGAAIHDILVLDAQQVALGDHDIDVPHQAGDTVQVQTVLQLHLCEGMAAGMRTDPYRGRDPHLFCGMLQYPCYGLIGHWLAVFAGEEILVASRVLLQVAIPKRAVLDELLGECG